MAENFQELRTNGKVKETKGKNFRKFDGGKLHQNRSKPSFIKINDLSLNHLTPLTISIITA